MKKVKIALLFSMVFLLVLAGSAFADHFDVVHYTDTDSDFDTDATDVPNSLIRNGAFDFWTGDNCNGDAGLPDNWCVWADNNGWGVHAGKADLAFAGDGINDGLTFYINPDGNTSGSGTAGAYQHLDMIGEAGYYFVSVSEAIWYIGQTAPYNSVAWYAISEYEDPSMVTEWRELDEYVIQCANKYEICDYAGRDETVWIDPGDYFHLRVQQKSAHFGATVFVIDDISIVAADGTDTTDNGFYVWVNDDSGDGDDKWHYNDSSSAPSSGSIVTVGWNQHAPR